LTEAEERLALLQRQIQAIQNGWPFFLALLQERIEKHTAALVNKNDEETRGRIKALQELKELPVTLQQERDGIRAGLAE
jgi:hypothetical protein